jgi:hypothetical protein
LSVYECKVNTGKPHFLNTIDYKNGSFWGESNEKPYTKCKAFSFVFILGKNVSYVFMPRCFFLY